MPRIERLKQNTREWHGWRLKGIGASDAPVVMGEAAFKTRRFLWSVKTGLARETAVGPAARRGRALEQTARNAYERHTGLQMEPLCLVHDRLEWMRASLDGLSFDGTIVLEIKCPWGIRDQNAVREGRIPAHYYAQVQHQLEVSGAEELHYWSFDGRTGTLVKVQHDRDYVAKLLEAETAFWSRVVERRWPDEGDELNLSDNLQWRSAASRYRIAKLKFDRAALEEKYVREELEKLATARRTYGCGTEVLRGLRKGSIDYSQVPELRGVQLEPYRKKPIEVVRINLSHSQPNPGHTEREPILGRAND
jgi:putative phage-type endonuclease